MLSDDPGELRRREVIFGFTGSTGGSFWRGGYTNERLCPGRRCVGNVLLPGVEVDVSGGRTARIIVELDPEVVKLGIGDDYLLLGSGMTHWGAP